MTLKVGRTLATLLALTMLIDVPLTGHAQDAKPFSNLDTAFNVARRVGGALELLVRFPANTGQLVIPLEQLN